MRSPCFVMPRPLASRRLEIKPQHYNDPPQPVKHPLSIDILGACAYITQEFSVSHLITLCIDEELWTLLKK